MTCSLPHPENDRQLSLKNFQSYTFNNQMAVFPATAAGNVSDGIISKKANGTLIAPFSN
jgi:hypothetical protein